MIQPRFPWWAALMLGIGCGLLFAAASGWALA
jgi:hypothetical protein